MLPFSRPADSNGDTVVFELTSVSGLTEWKDYIPVQAVSLDANEINRVSASGFQQVNALVSDSGLLPFKDYIPVYVVTGRTMPWNTDETNGYIPIYAAEGSINGGNGVLFPDFTETLLTWTTEENTGAIQDLAFSVDGLELTTVSGGGLVSLHTLTEAFNIKQISGVVSHDPTNGSAYVAVNFNADGTRLYLCDVTAATVYQFNLSTAYATAEIAAATEDASVSIIANASSMWWSEDGDCFYIGNTSGSIARYSTSSPYLVTGASLDYTDALPDATYDLAGGIWTADGTQLLCSNATTNTEHQYVCSTPFDTRTATLNGTSVLERTVTAGTAASPTGVFIPRGVDRAIQRPEAYIGFKTGNTAIIRYIWQLPHATTKNFPDISLQTPVLGPTTGAIAGIAGMGGLCLNANGTQIICCNHTSGVKVVPLSTAWDPSTAGAVLTYTPTVGGTPQFRQVEFNRDGTSLYISDFSGGNILQFNLTVPYDVSEIHGATADASFALATVVGMTFSHDGAYMYTTQASSNGNITRYALSTPWLISTASADPVGADSMPGLTRWDGGQVQDDYELAHFVEYNTGIINQFVWTGTGTIGDQRFWKATPTGQFTLTASGGGLNAGYHIPVGRRELYTGWSTGGRVDKYTW